MESQQPRAHRPLRIEQSLLERLRLWVEILALLAAGCWAIYTFLYETKIAPLLLPPHELISLNVQRVAQLPTGYVERVDVTLHNDGLVDVDTAAFAEDVYAASFTAFSHLVSPVGVNAMEYRYLPLRSWDVVQASGTLFDGAILGKRGIHSILHPGDSITLQSLAVVSRRYQVLRVSIQTTYDRYPIEPRIDVKLANKHGAVSLKADYVSTGFVEYFGV